MVQLQFELRIDQFAENDASFWSDHLLEGRRSLILDGGEACSEALCRAIAFKIVRMTSDGPPPGYRPLRYLAYPATLLRKMQHMHRYHSSVCECGQICVLMDIDTISKTCPTVIMLVWPVLHTASMKTYPGWPA